MLGQDICPDLIHRHIHDEMYDGIIISGYSSTIMAAGFFEAGWKNLYHNEQRPEFHIFSGESNKHLYRPFMIDGVLVTDTQRLKIVEQYIAENLPALKKLYDKKLCYLDKLVSSGFKYDKLRVIFQQLGFSKLTFAFFVAEKTSILHEDAFVGLYSSEATYDLLILVTSLNGYPPNPFKQTKGHASNQARQRINGLINLLK